MNKLIFLFLIQLQLLFGANILSYNIYDRTDRVDIMLTFDTPYEGKIVKNRYQSKILLKLYDAKIESTKIKEINSKFLQSIVISPMANYTQITATIPTSEVILKAAKTKDAYGLRLRFQKPTPQQLQHLQKNQHTNISALPTKASKDLSTSYYLVITILIVGIIILIILKRKLNPANNELKAQKNSSWLFKTPTPKQAQMAATNTTNEQNVTIRFQKNLDGKNSVVMFDFLNYSYLLLLGEHNNILLDKFTDNIPTTQSEFEALLQEKHTELDQFLQVEQKNIEAEERDGLKSFSQKASNIPYDL